MERYDRDYDYYMAYRNMIKMLKVRGYVPMDNTIRFSEKESKSEPDLNSLMISEKTFKELFESLETGSIDIKYIYDPIHNKPVYVRFVNQSKAKFDSASLKSEIDVIVRNLTLFSGTKYEGILKPNISNNDSIKEFLKYIRIIFVFYDVPDAKTGRYTLTLNKVHSTFPLRKKKDILHPDIEFFTIQELKVDITDIVTMPKFRVITDEEKENLLKKIAKKKLPQFTLDDRIVRYLAADEGDIIELLRVSYGSNSLFGSSVDYRVVSGVLSSKKKV